MIRNSDGIEISEIEDLRKFQKENFPDVQEADAILARKMANLSVEERSKVLVVETPELLSRSLFDLNVEVDKIEDKEAYLRLTISDRWKTLSQETS